MPNFWQLPLKALRVKSKKHLPCVWTSFFRNKTLAWASTYEPKPPWEKDIHYHNNDPNVLRRKLSWIKLGMMTFEPSWSDLSLVMCPGLWNFSILYSILWKTRKYGCLQQPILLHFRKKEITPKFWDGSCLE